MAPARDLPVPSAPLIGRADELAEVGRLLSTDPRRLVTLTGPPGVGKTRLALAAAHAHVARTPAEVVWVDLAAVTDQPMLAAEIARAVGLRDLAGLAAATAHRPLLLVLDNCEQLVEASGVLADLLAGAPRVSMLATSRQRLRLSAEVEYALAPLPMPAADDTRDLARLAANPAVELLLARAPTHVTLGPRSAAGLVDICIRLDGLPLALELAAARLQVFTPGELAFRLDHRFNLLTGGTRDGPRRHRDLHAAIAWSYDLLPPAEQAVFRRLSVFVDAWTLAAADAVCGDAPVRSVADALQSLVEKNLVRRLPDGARGARFAMLASLREFAAEAIAAAGEEATAGAAHARWFTDVARRWEASISTAAEDDRWLELGEVRNDLVTALATARRADDVDAVLWLASALAWFAYTRGTLGEARAVLDVVTAYADDARADPEARLVALVSVGGVALSIGEPEPADRDLRRAVEASERPGMPDGLRRRAIALAFLGHVARAQGRFPEAAESYAGARTAFEQLGSDRGISWATWDLGVLEAERGDLDRAERLVREALGVFETTDYPWAVAQAAWALAVVLLQRGRVDLHDEAAGLVDRALALHESVADRRGVAQCLEVLADLAVARDQAGWAARLLGAAAVRRDAAAARPSEAEQGRLDQLSERLVASLGPGVVDREHRAGRALADPDVLELAARVTAAPAPVALTGRQREVARLVAAGHTNRKIGRQLGISERTVEVHVHHLMDRLAAPSRAAVAAWAVTQPDRP